MLSWPIEDIEKALAELNGTFFEKYPQYAKLEPMITESETPDLWQALDIYERMRTKILMLLSILHEVCESKEIPTQDKN
jgi:predicted lipase